MVLESHFVLMVMGGGVMFRPVIPLLLCPWAPIKSELFLVDASIAQPMESHVHGFCAFWLDS
jgi:hypothetical protein